MTQYTNRCLIKVFDHDNTPKYNQFSPLYLLKDNNDRFFTSFVMIEIANKTKLENIYLGSRTPMISLFKTRDYPPVSTTDFKPLVTETLIL